MASIGAFGVRMDSGLSSVATARGGASPFNGSGHGMGMNLANNLGYGRVSSSFFNGNSVRLSNPIGFQGETRYPSGLTSNLGWLWGNDNLGSNASSANLGAFLGTGNGSFGFSLGNTAGSHWSPIQSSKGGDAALSYPNGTIEFGNGEGNAFGLVEGIGRRSLDSFVDPNSSFYGASANFEEGYSDLYRDGSGYDRSNWLAPTSEGNISGSFSYGFGDIGSEIGSRTPKALLETILQQVGKQIEELLLS
ncbi:hypothetical protein SAY87_003167 [Trapa incisa]|uniref:Uncharacterized protein n=1 Tax=Trapa incisa TaxID=236973 RepID=A0AAN7KIW2_9MYRT|nr:hypothetical protein SAY87_003167 [Trapa incisa]